MDVELDEVMVEAARSLPNRDPRRPLYGLGVLAADYELVADPPAPGGDDIPEAAAAGETRGVTFRRLQEEVTALQQRVDERERRLDDRERALEARIAAMEAELAILRRARGGSPFPPHDGQDDTDDLAGDD